MGFFKDLFRDDSAREAVQEQNRETLNFIKQTSGEARADARELFDKSLAARSAGNEQALALLAQVLPERMRLMQEGRQRTQDTLLGGSELAKRALLGLGTDMSILQKSPMEVDNSFMTQTLPTVASAESEMPQPGTPEYIQMIIDQLGNMGSIV
tara:strand:+ start:937 stop:1398 length:462 start_codon:yes stop_codon:yes gene_type:complete